MQLLRKLFGGMDSEDNDQKCPHKLLVPQWDGVEDMGNEEKITAYRCNNCATIFTPDEARELLERSDTILM